MVRTYPTILSCIIANDIYIGYREIDVIREPLATLNGLHARLESPPTQARILCEGIYIGKTRRVSELTLPSR